MKLSHGLFTGALVLASLGLPSIALAQGDGPAQGGGARLTQQQRQQVQTILKKYRQKHAALRQEMQGELKQILTDDQIKDLMQRLTQHSGQRQRPAAPAGNNRGGKDDDDD